MLEDAIPTPIPAPPPTIRPLAGPGAKIRRARGEQWSSQSEVDFSVIHIITPGGPHEGADVRA